MARLLEVDKLPANVSYTPSRNRQWHMYNCRWAGWAGQARGHWKTLAAAGVFHTAQRLLVAAVINKANTG